MRISETPPDFPPRPEGYRPTSQVSSKGRRLLGFPGPKEGGGATKPRPGGSVATPRPNTAPAGPNTLPPVATPRGSPASEERPNTRGSVTTRSSATAGGRSRPMVGKPRHCPRGPRFDQLTIIQWFFEIDSDLSGNVDKYEFEDFLEERRDICSQLDESAGNEDTTGLQRLIGVWNQVYLDGGGSLEWCTFVDLFRRAGLLVDYPGASNGRDRVAKLLFKMRYDAENVSDGEVLEFIRLRRENSRLAERCIGTDLIPLTPYVRLGTPAPPRPFWPLQKGSRAS